MISKYIQSKQNAWAPATLASEERRLQAAVTLYALETSTPEQFYAVTSKHLKPYALKTLFIRASEYKQWQGDASWKQFMKSNARLFKHVYQKKTVDVSFEEATSRISQVPNELVKQAAMLMLTTGMRIHEALKYDGGGVVVGKGGKPRPIFSDVRMSGKISPEMIRLCLRKVGITPHGLRKLAATRLAASGLKEADLMLVMGWSSITTASSYLQPLAQSVLEQKVREALNG
jgi:integrase